MTTKPKPATESVAATVGSDVERTGAICLRLESLGIDHQADDFPAQFIEFCEQNNLYEMEVNAQGELIILPMTGHRGNRHESYLNHFLTGWEIEHGGVASSQSSRYRLPSGEIRGPDAAWITQERYDALPEQQRLTIIESAPDFVVEIRSRTDDLVPVATQDGFVDGRRRSVGLADRPGESLVPTFTGRVNLNRKPCKTRKRWTAVMCWSDSLFPCVNTFSTCNSF